MLTPNLNVKFLVLVIVVEEPLLIKIIYFKIKSILNNKRSFFIFSCNLCIFLKI